VVGDSATQHAEDQQRASQRAKRFLRFTAKYLQKKIFCIVAASGTAGKVTKSLHHTRGTPVLPRIRSRSCPARRLRKPHNQSPLSSTITKCRSHPRSHAVSASAPPQPTHFHIGDEFGTAKRSLPPPHCPNLHCSRRHHCGIFAFQQRRNRRARVRLIL